MGLFVNERVRAMRFSSLTAIACCMAIGVCAAPARATTFAEYDAATSDANLDWTQSASLTGGTLSTTGAGVSANTYFTFLAPALSALANLPALFTLSATAPDGDPAVLASDQLAEENLSGTFSFTYTGSTPLMVGSHVYMTGANLLSGTFSGAELVGPAAGSTGSFQDAILSGGTVAFTSDIASFATTGDKGISLELTSVLPIFNAFPGQSLSSFSAVSTGSFASELNGGGGGGVPEPATWAAMLIGFGAIGISARRSRAKALRARA